MNPKFVHYVEDLKKNAVKFAVLKDSDDHFECIALLKINDIYCIYRNVLHDDRPEMKHNALNVRETFIADFHNDEKYFADKAFEKAKEGYVLCNFCKDWIPYEDAYLYVPAGCACKKESCIAEAKAAEKDFFSYPLD